MRVYPTEVQKKFIEWILDTHHKSVPQAELNTIKSVLTQGYATSSKGVIYRRQSILNKLREKYLTEYKFFIHYSKLAEHYNTTYLIKEK